MLSKKDSFVWLFFLFDVFLVKNASTPLIKKKKQKERKKNKKKKREKKNIEKLKKKAFIFWRLFSPGLHCANF